LLLFRFIPIAETIKRDCTTFSQNPIHKQSEETMTRTIKKKEATMKRSETLLSTDENSPDKLADSKLETSKPAAIDLKNTQEHQGLKGHNSPVTLADSQVETSKPAAIHLETPQKDKGLTGNSTPVTLADSPLETSKPAASHLKTPPVKAATSSILKRRGALSADKT
jgi:hypothetical protein